MANTVLNAAKMARMDEFYTQMPDIEAECGHYDEHFRGKVVLCNCDDPFQSNFVKYFMLKFKKLGLKRLISTCYRSQDADMFSRNDSDQAVYMIYDGEQKGNMPDWDARKVYPLKGDGDFRSEECVNLLKMSDVVVTNPPFSLFRPYISQLIQYDKKFLILGRMSALHYSEVFPLIKDNKVWMGYGFNLSMVYKTPYENNLESNQKYVRSKGYDPDANYIKVPAICWFTNLDHKKRHEELVLYKRYNADEYPRYYNFDAIDVSEIAAIPVDYTGCMGVPDTFLGCFNPDQFEIVGLGRDGDDVKVDRSIYPTVKKLNPNSRPSHIGYYLPDGTPKEPYSRIIIRRKQNQ